TVAELTATRRAISRIDGKRNSSFTGNSVSRNRKTRSAGRRTVSVSIDWRETSGFRGVTIIEKSDFKKSNTLPIGRQSKKNNCNRKNRKTNFVVPTMSGRLSGTADQAIASFKRVL